MTITVVFRHLGPGPHPGGSPQSVHGKKGLAVHEDVPEYVEPAKSEPLEIAEPNATNQPTEWHNINTMTFNWHPEAAKFLWEEFGPPPLFTEQSPAVRKSRKALSSYRQNGYEKLNKELRQLSSHVAELVWGKKMAAIDSAITHELSRDLVVFRGVGVNTSVDTGGQVVEMQGLKSGDEFTDRAYTSTTVSRSIGERFVRLNANYNPRRGGGVLCRVTLPKGTRCTEIVDRYDPSLTKLNPLTKALHDAPQDEMEILLPRGSTFHVDSVGEEQGMKVINMTLVQK